MCFHISDVQPVPKKANKCRQHRAMFVSISFGQINMYLLYIIFMSFCFINAASQNKPHTTKGKIQHTRWGRRNTDNTGLPFGRLFSPSPDRHQQATVMWPAPCPWARHRDLARAFCLDKPGLWPSWSGASERKREVPLWQSIDRPVIIIIIWSASENLLTKTVG